MRGPDEFGVPEDRGWRAFLNRHPNLIAYFLITVVFVISTVRQANVVNTVRQESQARSIIACRVINENKALVKDFTDILITVSTANPRPNQTPEEKAQGQRAIDQFLALLAPRFKPIDCNQFIKDPEQYLHSVVPPTTTARSTSTTMLHG